MQGPVDGACVKHKCSVTAAGCRQHHPGQLGLSCTAEPAMEEQSLTCSKKCLPSCHSGGHHSLCWVHEDATGLCWLRMWITQVTCNCQSIARQAQHPSSISNPDHASLGCPGSFSASVCITRVLQVQQSIAAMLQQPTCASVGYTWPSFGRMCTRP